MPPNSEKEKPMIYTRTILWYLVFVGFAVNYMVRINASITIVDMILPRIKHRHSANVTECIPNSPEEAFDLNKESMNITREHGFSIERVILDYFKFPYDHNGFDWDEHKQGLVLGSFFWIHWITQIPGGILARKYGTKIVFGLSNLIGCCLCFFMPIFAYLDYRILIFLRVIQGIINGLSWPAMHNMTAQWIPPNERSKFVTAYLGSSIGIAVCYPLFGYIIAWSSWEWVYHFSGIIGIIWYLGWYFLVYDTPAKHPKITPREQQYIQKALGSSIQLSKKEATPWKAILTERAVWMTVVAQWGGIWGLFTLMTQAPSYFNYIHGWNIKMTGILSGIPHVMRTIFALLFSIFGDYLLKSGKLSRTQVRKMAGTVCCIVNGIFVVALAYSGCNSTAAVAFLTLGTAFHGAVSTGPLANIVDLSPNYAGVVLGISGMIGVLPGFISPIIVGILTYQNQTIQQWKYVFLITGIQLIICGVLYVLFSDSDIKPWNNPSRKKESELESLKNKKENVSIIITNFDKEKFDETEECSLNEKKNDK